MTDDSDDFTVTFPVELDPLTTARLMRLCETVGTAPARVMASILHDVLEDDARENVEAVQPPRIHLH